MGGCWIMLFWRRNIYNIYIYLMEINKTGFTRPALVFASTQTSARFSEKRGTAESWCEVFGKE